MSECRHTQRLAHSWLNGHWIEEPYIAFRDAALILCVDCRESLSLGPSNDSDPRVAIEIRAAALVEHIDDWAFGMLDDDEIRGYSLAEASAQQHTDGWHAGYLARCIAEHKDNDNG